MSLEFLKSQFQIKLLSFEKVIIPGRLKCCGMEDRTVVAYFCRKTKKVICVQGRGKMLWPWPPAFPFKRVSFIFSV